MTSANEHSGNAADTFISQVNSFYEKDVTSICSAKTMAELVDAHQAHFDHLETLKSLTSQLDEGAKEKTFASEYAYRTNILDFSERMSTLLGSKTLDYDKILTEEEFEAIKQRIPERSKAQFSVLTGRKFAPQCSPPN